MMYWYDHMSGWGYLFMGLTTVAFWGLLIAAVVLLVRGFGSDRREQPPAPRPQSTPERILAERFARGEIDEDEYRQRLETLRHSGHLTPA